MKQASSDFIALAVLALGAVVWLSSLPWNGGSGSVPIAGEVLKLIVPAIAGYMAKGVVDNMGKSNPDVDKLTAENQKLAKELDDLRKFNGL
jgi:hypothetical protein